MFSRVLVANRGEIAVRVIKAARELALTTVAIYSDDDRGAAFVDLADIAVHLPGPSATETYLNIDAILRVALEQGVEAVHPGYGFLSENPEFAAAVENAGMKWIGPTSETIETLGNKISAKEVAKSAGAPLAPAAPDPIESAAEVIEFASATGYPVVIKAAMGGGGRGMKVVWSEDDASANLESARQEARIGFGDDTCFVEKYLEAPRHIEVQIAGDNYGNVVAIGTRDCSLQRRHQKLVEESPAPFLSDSLEDQLLTAAEEIGRLVGYTGVGTVEFLVGRDETVTFLEVNTRLQVEHSVTESAYDVDLVHEQFHIAAGHRLSLNGRPQPKRHAIEFRINAEDVGSNFLPDSGTIEQIVLPTGPGIRIDSGVRPGSKVTTKYDSLLLKLIVSAENRATAVTRARMALDEMRIVGVETVLPFARWVLGEADFVAPDGRYSAHTTWIDAHSESIRSDIGRSTPTASASSQEPSDCQRLDLLVNGKEVTVHVPDALLRIGSRRSKATGGSPSADVDQASEKTINSPMAATLTSIDVSQGEHVTPGRKLCTIEAMKMEHDIHADTSAQIDRILVEIGSEVQKNQPLVVMK